MNGYHIWDIDEMSEAELQELFPSEESGREHKAEVIRFLHSEGLLENDVYNLEWFLNLYMENDLGQILAIDSENFDLYAAHLSNEQLLEYLPIIGKKPKRSPDEMIWRTEFDPSTLGKEAAIRVLDGRIPLSVVLECNNLKALYDFFSYLIMRFLITRENIVGNYFELQELSETYIGQKIHADSPLIKTGINIDRELLIYGTDEEREIVSYQNIHIHHLADHLVYYDDVDLFRLKDAIRYLYSVGVNLGDIILYFDDDPFDGTADKIINVIIGYILDYIGYDEELISKLTNPEIIETINEYYSQI
jgi:hypothetical protein